MTESSGLVFKELRIESIVGNMLTEQEKKELINILQEENTLEFKRQRIDSIVGNILTEQEKIELITVFQED